MKMLLLIFSVLLSLNAFAVPDLIILNGAFAPAEPGQGQITLKNVNGSIGWIGTDGRTQAIGASPELHYDLNSYSSVSGAITLLSNYSMPANTLVDAGESIAFYSAGTFPASATTDKRITVKFGSATIVDTGSMSFAVGGTWQVKGNCLRVASMSQKCQGAILTSVSSFPVTVSYAPATADLTGVVNLQVLSGAGTGNAQEVGQIFKVIFEP